MLVTESSSEPLSELFFLFLIIQLKTDFDVVVNCSGVNAYHLVNDKEVTPIRGQLVKVR